MLLRLFLLLAIGCALTGSEIELFCDWSWDAKGQDLFPLPPETPPQDLSLVSLIRKKLKESGHEIRSWELESYRPWLLHLRAIKSFQDLKHLLKIGLSRKDPFLPQTKYWMFWNLGPKLKPFDFSKVPKEKLILVMWEPPTVQPELYDPAIQAHFGKIFTWDDDLVDNQKFFKIHYPALKPRIHSIPTFEEKKFCVMICRRLKSPHPKELYSQRKEMIRFFEDKPDGELDLYGYGWKAGKHKSVRGPLHSDKVEKLKEYKFSICYENMRDVKGYITEKMFDCLAAGVVPVYWGASNVTDFIPQECFIDRRKFKDNEELYQFLKSISKEQYQIYLDRAAEFLSSEQAKKFTNEFFASSLLFLLSCIDG